MRFWLDTEFIEDGRTIDLVSIGIVRQDDREYYAISSEFDPSKAGDWVKRNVLTKLGDTPRRPRAQIRHEIERFVGYEDPTGCAQGRGDRPEFWGYYADYDWVVLCQLFGPMVKLPRGWPMFCRDIKQLAEDLGNPQLPPEGKNEHNALADAWWNRKAWEFLTNLRSQTRSA